MLITRRLPLGGLAKRGLKICKLPGRVLRRAFLRRDSAHAPSPCPVTHAAPEISKVASIDSNVLERIGRDETLLWRAVQANVNQNDRALCNLLHHFRLLRQMSELAGRTFHDQTILEMGASRAPGLPMILLLEGCRTYYANNIFPLHNWLPEGYVNLLDLFLTGLRGRAARRLDDLVSWEAEGERRIARLRPEVFIDLSPRPAEAIDLPADSVDLAFSCSVLEHVRKPSDVLASCARLLKPNGCCFHLIDLRDHSDFRRPLDFLKLSDEEYVAKTGGTENRVRAGEWLDLFAAAGLDVAHAWFLDNEVKLTAAGRSDLVDTVQRPLASFYPRTRLADVVPWVDEPLRASFHPRFRGKSLAELSVLGMMVIARKPARPS